MAGMMSRPDVPRPSANSDIMIVSGGDAVYFPLIDELRRSIAAAFPDDSPAFGVIDAGLLPEQTERLRASGVSVARVPDDPAMPAAALRKRPALAANLGKLWLDRMFPGYEVLVWLDADTWVQDAAAVRMMAGAARTGALAIVPGGGRFGARPMRIRWLLGGLFGLAQIRSFNFKNGRHAGLSLAILRDLGSRSLLNAGAFGLRADAAHWEVMRKWQTFVLRRGKPFTSDQIAIALTIYTDGLPVELLPDTCNHLGPYRFDPDEPALLEFWYPYPKVGIIHLANQEQLRFDPAATVTLLDIENRPHQVNPRYGLLQAAARGRVS